MFAVINPQPNGAGFAGVKSNITFEGADEKEGIPRQLIILESCSHRQ
jgi:hypothetical protein